MKLKGVSKVEEPAVKDKNSLLKATPEIREALDNLGETEKFSVSATLILKYIDASLQPSLISSISKLDNCKNIGSSSEIKGNTENLSEDVKYVIRRLVYGIASKRKFCRHGFYVALQALLQIHPEFLQFTFLAATKFYSQEQNKSYITDHVIGHILTLGAIIRSGCIAENHGLTQVIVKKLHILRTRSMHTDPIVGQFIVNLLTNGGSDAVGIVWEEMRENLIEPVRLLPPSLLWIRIVLCRNEFLNKLPNVPSNFQKETLSYGSYQIIYSIMKKMFHDNMDVVPLLQDYLLSLSLFNDELVGNENLVSFFSKVVVPALEDPSPHKISFNFTITELIIPYLSETEQIKSVLCSAFVQQLLSAGSLKGEVAVNSARKIVAVLLQKIIDHKDQDDEVQITILKQLVNSPGTVRFDKLTGTKLFQLSFEHLKVSTVKELTKNLIINIENEKYEDSKGMNGLCLFSGELISAAQWVSRLVSHPKVSLSEHMKWRASQLALLLKNIFFRRHPSKELQTLKETFTKALEHPTRKLEDQIVAAEKLVEKTDVYVRKFKKDCLLSPEAKQLWRKVCDTLKQQQEHFKDQPQKDMMIFRLLYCQMNLHLFINPETAKEVIDELDQCYMKACQSKSGRKKSVSADTDSEPEWLEVVVDVLLSLLSKGDHYWRKIVITVFRNICHQMNPAAMSLITDIINPEKDANFLTENDDEEDVEMEEEDASDDDEEEGDVDEEADDDGTEDENETDEETDGESDDDEMDNEKDQKSLKLLQLQQEMQKIVGLPDEDVDLDAAPEEELNNLDKELGALMKVYQSYKKHNKKSKKFKLAKDETSLMHFRTRVCDLLEGLVIEAPSFNHLVHLVSPLLLAIDKFSRDALQQQLCKRLKTVLSELVKVKKFVSSHSNTTEDVASEIGPLFDLSHKLSSSMSKEVGMCCTFFVKCGLHIAEETDLQSSSVVIEAYIKQLELFFSKKDWDISEVAFTGPLTLDTGALLPVLQLLVQYSFDSGVRFFRRQQALDMLRLLFNNKRSLVKMPFKSVKSSQKKISTSIIELFNSFASGKKIKILHVVAIFNLLKTLRVVHKHNGEFEKSFRWAEVNEAIKSFHRSAPLDQMKSLKKAFVALSEVLHIKLEKESSGILKKTMRVHGSETGESSGILKKTMKVNGSERGITDCNKKEKHEKTKETESEEDMLVPFTQEEEPSPKANRKRQKKEEKKEAKRRKLEDKNEDINEEKLQKLKAKKREKKMKKLQKRKAKQDDAKYIPELETLTFISFTGD